MRLFSLLANLFRSSTRVPPAPSLRTDTIASSFADLADVADFKACKRTGRSDVSCFREGDNGRGCWGDVTAQDVTPMCALPPEEIRRHCGSTRAADARGRRVHVILGGRAVVCLLADRMPEKEHRKNGAGIDLNPAALRTLRVKAPIMLPCSWAWLD
jgi:hypothetical protein